MIEYKTGSIFKSDAIALVNPVNCVGVSGSGLAAQFKERYAPNYRFYRAACNANQVMLGKMYITHGPDGDLHRYIINFPTKQHWKDLSHMSSISEGLKDLRNCLAKLNIQSVAIPQIGCGLGGLSWTLVKPVILSTFIDAQYEDSSLRVQIYEGYPK